MPIFKNPNFDFLKWRWPAVGLSLVIILAGAVAMALQGGPTLGIDFSGGTIVVVKFDAGVTEDAVRGAISGIADENVVQQFGSADANEILIRLPQSGPEAGTSLELGANAVRAALDQSTLGGFDVINTQLVGPIIGEELRSRGINAFVFAMAGILVYIGLRFRFSFAVGAVIAVAHDILVTWAMLTFFGYELSLNVVAAMLAITGYSVNDSIVVFDRVRENLRHMRRDSFDALVNASINQTLSRTIITSGTTAFAVLALYLFGGEVLEGFAFTMLVGVISGTYSTIFIAAAAAIVISERRASRRAQVTSAPATAKSKRRSKKAHARARA
ncbi:MAG: protein translocase subunit SecF [Vicinamibacterales bacterium]|jgi:preprotein translocase subunit SecF|nr:protein translocase subunit SecF [Vicinamibacterales bacterium]MDP7480863.1 protein translocase subunit SecF [Vicinamibacterales bacterium]HJN43783.1 protein translocase subunit SecF [Vicinamibacterales bacterium]